MTIKEFYDITKGNYDVALSCYKDDNTIIHFLKMFVEDKSYNEFIEAYQKFNEELMISKAHTIKLLSKDLGFSNLYQTIDLLLEDLREDKLRIKELTMKLIEDYEFLIKNIKEIYEDSYLVQ